MRTSNKILLGAFITALLILVSINISIYAKYKRGEFTAVSDDIWMPNMASFSLQDVKYVAVDNIENISLHISDTSSLKYDKWQKNDENILTFDKRADTLFIAGKSTRSNEGRWYRNTHLYLANGLPVKFINSNLHLEEKNRNVAANSLDISLDHSSLEIVSLGNNTSFLSNARISASNKSRIYFGDVFIRSLQLNLMQSIIEDKNLVADSIHIRTDASSQLDIRSANLLKAKLAAHE